MFGGNALIAFAPYGPGIFIGDHMLVPGSPSFPLAGTIEKNLDQFYEKGHPRLARVVFRHGVLGMAFEDTIFGEK